MIDWDNVTCGLEIELPRSHHSTVEGVSEIIPLSPHDDGSLRRESYLIANNVCVLPLQRDGRDVVSYGMVPQRAYGLELVTSATKVKDIRERIPIVSRHYKHLPKDDTCSLHVHVDIADQPWRYVQRIFHWAYALEAVLFRLSCAGKLHRGITNDYQFCRPLSMPIGAIWGRARGPLILWNDFINATTSSQMAFAWGRTDLYYDEEWSIPHYVAHRYHMVNLMSCFRLGTFEWRLFDPLYEFFDLFFEVVIAVHKLAEKGSPEFQPMLLGTSPDITSDAVCELLGVDISPLWGDVWCPAPQRINPDAHTGGMTFNRAGAHTIRFDSGSDTDPLFMR